MHYLQNFPRTCGLALIICCCLSGKAQDDLYHLLRFTIVPGQELTFIRANAPGNGSAPDRSAQPRSAYVYDNHTIEVLVPTRELNDANDGPTKAWAELYWEPFADWTETRHPKTMAPTLDEYLECRLRRHADLSYTPAQAAPRKPASYRKMVTYLAEPGQLEKVKETTRRYAAQLREVNSPLSFEFRTYDRGEPVEMFEIAYPAECPDDLAERRAVHQAITSRATKQWRNSLASLAYELRSVTGRYVTELSIAER